MNPESDLAQLRRTERAAIGRQALPLLFAQLSSMAMLVIDSVLLGHYGALDLAAIAVGGGVYISVQMALVGILQSLGPIVAHHVGAGHRPAAAAAFWQGVWLALLLALPGMALLFWPGPILGLSSIEPPVELRVRAVLDLLAIGIPAALLYRVFAAFTNALGHSRVLMTISFSATALHAVVASALVNGWLWWPPLGALGCAISTGLVHLWTLLFALWFLARGEALRPWQVLASFAWPRWRHFGEFFRIGLPMGFSNLVEISSFTLIALFAAPLGASVVSGHRIVGNLAALAYMVPLSIAIATLSRVGQAAGARDFVRCEIAARQGIRLAAVIAALVGVVGYALGPWLIGAFTDDRAVVAAALPMLAYVAVYQVFDAWQTVAGFALRGLKVTLAPLLIHVAAFWGIGLAGGAWLAYRGGMGLGGFWAAAAASTVVAALAFIVMLRAALRLRQALNPPASASSG